ncbi:MAG TPA: hypothetical protein PKO41_07150 [Dokdonella sp.]|uniref:hypothetical protein n=1 Tax=Dokdonella sp. TaxID=2291710 RepID=UPI0025BBB782|nr:hypothetical protein [Dokdonella sp.]MBX3693009.1 hypothetical protein [Dokdonella sp.]HNR92184.1 hypothetical protein [Dokdonella sp.]
MKELLGGGRVERVVAKYRANLPLRVIGREDPLGNKRATRRLKDRMDVDEFGRAEREGEGKE